MSRGLARRQDDEELLKFVAPLCRGINQLCVTRRGKKPEWPADDLLYRGGGLPLAHQTFFRTGVKYRAPTYVAFSFEKRTAINFLRNTDALPVLWTARFDRDLRCDHCNFLEELTLVKHEKEMLFAPYSVFTVESVEVPTSPKWTNPIKITLFVEPDNTDAPEDLPLAPWC